MTAVLFDMDYNTIEESRFRYVVEAVETSNKRLGVLIQASGLTFRGLDKRLFPQSAKAAARFVKFLRKLLQERLQRDTTETKTMDVFSFLQRCKDPETGKALSAREVSTETATFIVAGKLSSSVLHSFLFIVKTLYTNNLAFLQDPTPHQQPWPRSRTT